MRLLIIFIFGVMLIPCRGLAQEDSVSTASYALQSVLSALKQSAENLSLDNKQLASKTKDIKQQISMLQAQLGRVEALGDGLNNSVAMLRGKDPRQAQQITQLEEENSYLDHRSQKIQDTIKLVQESMDAGYHEDQKFLLQLKEMSIVQPIARAAPSPEYQPAVTGQKEKLKLMKMIYDSQERQESLHASILELQKNTPLLPAASALARQQFLKEQIKAWEAQIPAYPPEKISANLGLDDQWGSSQLRQLASELKVLEKNYIQLKILMEKMDQKAQSVKMTVSQHIEEHQLQGKLDDLKHQGEGLRADLDDLRSQMVDLDKRKSRLEMMIKQLP